MPSRTVTFNGAAWRVMPSGLITQYSMDEFGLIFTRGDGDRRETRVMRYSPGGTRSREQSFAELTDEQLQSYLRHSQPSPTSPEAHYAR